MKSFDLTFSGTVLPKRDPQRVKRDFAQLFGIEDRALIEEIFSGETIILRHNLDRKTAADFFRKISELGGKANLVTSLKHRAAHGDTTMKLDQETGCNPRIIRHPAPEDATQTNFGLSNNQNALNRQQALASLTMEKSLLVSAKLQKRKEQFNRIAEQELAKIEQQSQEIRISLQRELAEMKAIEEQTTRTVTAEIERMDQQKTLCKEHANQQIARLEALEKKARAGGVAAMDNLKQSLEETRLFAEEDIRRLQQLLQDTRRQAELDMTELEQQLSDVKLKTQQEILALEHQRDQTLCTLEENIRDLGRQQEVTKKQFESNAGDLKQRQLATQQQKEDELRGLQASELDIKRKRKQGIADVERANRQLGEQAQEALKQLHALTLEVEPCQKEG